MLLYLPNRSALFYIFCMNIRSGSRTAATSKVELFVIIVNYWKPLTIITKSSTLDVEAVLDPPLNIIYTMKKWKILRILTGKKHPKIKPQRLQKIRILTFGLLVHQINSFYEVLKLEQIFQKTKVVTGKTPLFVIGPFFSRHSICLNIGFWQSSFERKWCVFNLSGFN